MSSIPAAGTFSEQLALDAAIAKRKRREQRNLRVAGINGWPAHQEGGPVPYTGELLVFLDEEGKAS